MTTEKKQQLIGGRHPLTLEDGLVYVYKQTGDFTLEEAKELCEVMDTWVPSPAPSFMLCDSTKAEGMSPAARAYIGEWSKAHPRRTYVGIYGGSFQMRAITNLLFTAMRMVGQPVVGSFEKDEESARAFIRKHVEAEAAKKSA